METPMKTLPLSEVKMKLSKLVDSVSATDEEIVITKNGYPTAVLVSTDEFEGWKETLTVRCDDELMGEIETGLSELKAKKAKLYTLDELFQED